MKIDRRGELKRVRKEIDRQNKIRQERLDSLEKARAEKETEEMTALEDELLDLFEQDPEAY